MRGYGYWINLLLKFASEGSGDMSLLKKMKTKIRAVPEPDSLDIVERVLEEEERRMKNDLEFGSPDWLRLANVVLVLTLVLFLLIAWHVR